MKLVEWLLREPLLHFLAIGGLIFLLFAAVTDQSPEPDKDTIVVGPEHLKQLARGFEATWRRQPTDDELLAMIDGFVREEIYYREGLALGLDRNDAVVRRRIRQKVEFLTDTAADLLEPAASELEAYLAANEQNYRRGPRLAFEQIFLGEAPDGERITRALSTLQSGSTADPFALGNPTLLPPRLGLSPPVAIDGVFGQGFFKRLADFTPGSWSGPVVSGYGVHLVRILDSHPARTLQLEEVREEVLRDWKAAKGLEIRELHYARLRERYVVEVRAADEPTEENR